MKIRYEGTHPCLICSRTLVYDIKKKNREYTEEEWNSISFRSKCCDICKKFLCGVCRKCENPNKLILGFYEIYEKHMIEEHSQVNII